MKSDVLMDVGGKICWSNQYIALMGAAEHVVEMMVEVANKRTVKESN